MLSLDEWTEEEETVFSIEEDRTHTKGAYTDRLVLEYRMNKDVIRVERAIYNFFMFLGDVGGLYGIFVSFASTCLGFFNYFKADNILASGLFTLKKSNLKSSKQSSLKECL